jgi:hypothetical protein
MWKPGFRWQLLLAHRPAQTPPLRHFISLYFRDHRRQFEQKHGKAIEEDMRTATPAGFQLTLHLVEITSCHGRDPTYSRVVVQSYPRWLGPRVSRHLNVLLFIIH